ncbi:hypothetical protein BH11VER1_BH11VER1_25560 [soil metagenome]
MRPIVWLPVTIVALILLGIMWRINSTTSLPASQLPIKLPVAQKKEGLRVSSDRSWNDLSEKELRELSSYFGDRNSHVGSNNETVVSSGESILLDVYEGFPGEFVFSKVTPRVKKFSDGTNTVEVNVDSFSVSISGDTKQLYSNTSGLPPNTILRTGGLVGYDTYTVLLSAKIEGDDSKIRVKAKGEYTKPILPKKP